ncbi:hypothetical protein AG1IA_09454 [Rhizoctonia solani AG-1 IA]|uniref:Uncharacterized protein n=1 Tax=Thanatephorus cucumeris (strain AG1-IA) TaxID=983506 RepID=L8WEA0_THACA|nr:hypothetical protein AG1IA_09454 [Rhizoctonia solani AG-1 IA]
MTNELDRDVTACWTMHGPGSVASNHALFDFPPLSLFLSHDAVVVSSKRIGWS